MGGENEVEGSYEEGDGDEIMVEIVGSDVFVDGVVGGRKEGFLGFGDQVEDLKGHAWENRGGIVSPNFSDENRRGESDNLVMSEVLNPFVEERIGEAEKEWVLSSNDNAANVDPVGENSANVGVGEAGLFDAIGGERDEANDENFDDEPDFKEGASDILPGDDKYMKNGRDLETDMVYRNHVVSDILTERADAGEIAEASEDNGLNIEIRAGTEENGGLIGEKVAIFQMKVVDGETVVDFREPGFENEQHISETENFKLSDEKTMKKPACPLKPNQSSYLLPDNDGHFAQSDLVWGKVRNHPWWPGQIFDPADASEKAVKHYKRDSYLVAYFGDGTFAWNGKSNLKPFKSYFSEMERQSNSESFQNAVASALDEVSRRVELGLACSCVPRHVYGKIEAQIVENAGICEESGHRYGVDHSSQASCFEPNKLLEYVSNLAAPFSFSGADRLDLAIAQAEMSAFCRFKGYRSLTKFTSSGEFLENDEKTSDQMVGSEKKRKRAPKEGSQSRKKRSLMEFEGKTVSIYGEKRVSTLMSQSPKPSFKIGECISRVASRLKGSTSLEKSNTNNDGMINNGSPEIYEHSENQSVLFSAEYFSVDEILLQLQLVAQDPKKWHDFENNICNFLIGFRGSIATNRRVRKQNAKKRIGRLGEEFEFDDMDDSYWTDKIPINSGCKTYSRRRFSDPMSEIELDENFERREQESSPTELIMNFAETKWVPSEISLNKIFRRFGPLMESETELDHELGRARVIFKRALDAEVARSSATIFNIFGAVLVSYEIGYSPLISVKILPIAVPRCQEDETLMI